MMDAASAASELLRRRAVKGAASGNPELRERVCIALLAREDVSHWDITNQARRIIEYIEGAE